MAIGQTERDERPWWTDGGAPPVTPEQVAATNLAECCRWGAERLGDAPEASRLATLLERTVGAAEGSGMPLFAAWRAMPAPDPSPGARVAVGSLLLREHFAGAHLLAVRAAGMTPLVRRRLRAEAVTDRLASTAFRVLGPGEGAELLNLLTAARLHPPGR